MRTSHLSVKRKIADRKKSIMPEEIFSSRQYAAYLTDIAEGITKRYRRTTKVNSYWDDSKHAEVAYTDNKSITINTGNDLSRSFPTKELMAESHIGIIGHECGHILFTDFSMLSTYNRALSGGRFYPNEPGNLSPVQEKHLLDIKECFEDKDEAVIVAVSKVTHMLVNIMEDVYIEDRMCTSFPGVVKTGILLNNIRFAEDMDSITTQLKEQHYEVSILINLLIQYAKTGDINNPDGYKGPLLNVIYDCIPHIDESALDDDAKVRFDAANQILLYLWPHMDSFIEKVREDLKKGTDNASAALGSQVASGNPLPTRSGTPIPGAGKMKRTPFNKEEELEEIQQVLDYESGRMALEETEDILEDGDGGISKNTTYSGSGYLKQAEADMERLLTQLAEENVMESYEDDLTAKLQEEADRIRYGNAHRGIHVKINRMSFVDTCYMEAYKSVAPPLLLISKRLQRQISQVLKDYKEGAKLDHLPFGKRLNARNLYQQDGKFFYKMKLPGDKVDIAVAILNDESGSMCCKDRITFARCASIILHDFCKALNIPIAVYGHTEYDNVELFAYAEYDSLDDKDKYRLMDMSARSGNRDGAALRFVAERLLSRPEEIKLLIIISDGQPAASGYYGTAAEADLRGIKQEYSKKGIQLFAAAIGDDKPNIQRIYGDGFLDITRLEELPMRLGKLIISQVKNKYSV